MGKADLVVVGGGVIGLAVAWRCRDAGAEVTVVDPSLSPVVRGGITLTPASSAAAGMLAPVTEAHYGEEALVKLNLASAELWPSFARAVEEVSGEKVGYRSEGTIAVAFDGGDRTALEKLHRFQVSLGLDSTWLGPLACRSLEPLLAPSIRGGLLVPGDNQVDPRRLRQGLLSACRASGVHLVNDEVAGISTTTRAATGVRLGRGGELRAKETVLAAGWRSSAMAGLPDEALPPVRPVKGQILRLAVPEGSSRPTHNLRAIVQASSIYVVPRQDGEVVVGATVEEMGQDRRVTAGAVYSLLRDAQLLLPGLSEAELVECTVARRPGSPDNLPIIGRGLLDGLVIATGHYRNGIHLTPITADLVTTLTSGGDMPAWAGSFDPRRFETASTTRRP
ncbi:MAG: glycine oxidase ThiO [Acidimicrobiales bacterium]